MRQQDRVLALQQRRVNLRLTLIDVEASRCDLPGLQGLGQRRFIDHRTTRSVDEDRRRLHPGKQASSDEVASPLAARGVQRKDVCRLGQRLQ